MAAKKEAPPPVVEGPWTGWVRLLLAVFAGLFLLTVWVDTVKPRIADKVVPRPIHYFAQMASLFPTRAEMSIEYRALGFRCDTRKYAELDVRPHFPMHADDKENRYDRAMFFYGTHANKTVLRALESYVLDRHNARVVRGETTDLPLIGGVVFLSLRRPIPEPGSDFERYERRPADETPTELRKVWFKTPKDEAKKRCDALVPRAASTPPPPASVEPELTTTPETTP